jgi:hypothetical protein
LPACDSAIGRAYLADVIWQSPYGGRIPLELAQLTDVGTSRQEPDGIRCIALAHFHNADDAGIVYYFISRGADAAPLVTIKLFPVSNRPDCHTSMGQ